MKTKTKATKIPKPTTVTVEVTKKHFDAAMAAMKAGKQVTLVCLVAQAVKSLFPKKTVHVYSTTATVGGTQYELPAKATKLIGKFDEINYGDIEKPSKEEKAAIAKLRNSLPFTFKMTELVAKAAVA